MQLYRTTGSVQQEQESRPLTSNAEHTGPALNRSQYPRDNQQYEETCFDGGKTFRFLLVHRLDTTCSTPIKRSVTFGPRLSFCSRLPAPDAGDRNLAPSGVRMSSAPFLFRSSSRGDAAQSPGRRLLLFNPPPRPDGTAARSRVQEPPAAAQIQAGRRLWPDQPLLTTWTLK